MNKRYIITMSLLLLVSIMLTLVSCSGGADNTAASTDTTVDTAVSETLPAETELSDNLPDTKFNGEELTMLIRSEFLYEFDVEGLTGDIVSDSVYTRNRDIEERFDIRINIVDVTGSWSTQAQFLDTLSSSVMAADGAFSLVASAANYMLPTISNGYFMDLYAIPYIDLEKPWWSQGYVENMTIDGSLYLATGSASINFLDNMCVMFFNKGMVESYDLDNPYDLVNNGNWTFDRLMEMSSAVTGDINGDGEIKVEDRIGHFTYGNMLIALTQSFNLDFSKRGDDGYPYITYMTDRMASAFDKMTEFYNSDDMLVYTNPGDTLSLAASMQNIFSEGNKLIMSQVLSSASVMRDMETDFGIIPMPKYDDIQDRYYTCVMENLTVLGVPTSAEPPELSGILAEALAAEGYKEVTPAYFDIALQGKYSRDNESAEMLELIRDSAWFDFAYLNSVSLGSINHLFNNQMYSGGSLASAFEAQKSQFDSKMAVLLDGYKSLKK